MQMLSLKRTGRLATIEFDCVLTYPSGYDARQQVDFGFDGNCSNGGQGRGYWVGASSRLLELVTYHFEPRRVDRSELTSSCSSAVETMVEGVSNIA